MFHFASLSSEIKFNLPICVKASIKHESITIFLGLNILLVYLQIGTVLTHLPHGIDRGLHPAVGLHSDGEEVRINLDASWHHQYVTLMAIDSCEEDWVRLHDVRVNGQVSVFVCV